MPKKLRDFGESILELKEAFCEEELLAASHHKRVEHTVLLLRNLAVAAASVLFFVSLFHVPSRYLLKAIAYFLGAAACTSRKALYVLQVWNLCAKSAQIMRAAARSFFKRKTSEAFSV